jgi:hypothetical protein
MTAKPLTILRQRARGARIAGLVLSIASIVDARAAEPGVMHFEGAHGEAKLTPELVREKLNNPKLSAQEAAVWNARAFWLEPSLRHWLRAGRAIETAAKVPCTVEPPADELPEAPLTCPKNPDFDDMKSALAEGFVAFVSAEELMSEAAQNEANERSSPYRSALRRANLTPVKPSFFQHAERLVIAHSFSDPERALALADALSSTDGKLIRVKITSASHYSSSSEQNRGLWDIGTIRATLNEPAAVHAVTMSGKMLTVALNTLSVDLGGSECFAPALTLEPRKTGNSADSGQAIVSWAGKAPKQSTVSVSTRRSDGRSPEDKLVIDDIDLDGDGIPDLSRWRGHFVPSAVSEGLWTAILANLGGEWILVDYDQSDDCE